MASLVEGIFTLETGLPLSTGVSDLEKNNPAPAGGYSPKRIYDSDKLGLTHVAFDAGIELPEHSAPVPIVVQIAQGALEFHAGGVVHRLSSGSVLHLGAGVPHSVHSVEPSHVIVTFLK